MHNPNLFLEIPLVFWLRVWGKKPSIPAQTHGKSTYKYNSSHLQLFISDEAVQEKGKR